MKGKQWKIFKDAETGKEYLAYTLAEEGAEEEKETKELLAYQNGITPEQITVTIESRHHEQRTIF